LGCAEETYTIDNSHAEIGFGVQHLVISKVKGKFNEFSGSLVLDDQGNFKTAQAEVKVASIDTGNAKRDEHLRSSDFFDTIKYPAISYMVEKIEKRDGKNVMIGPFTMHGVTRELVLPFTLHGPITDPWGNKRIGVEAATVINRTDYGLTWNKIIETGGVMVGEEVEISVNFEAVKK
jgi:polyisoprenoid-binding protein YceI